MASREGILWIIFFRRGEFVKITRMIYDPRSIQLSPQQQDEIARFAERAGLPWELVLENALRQIALRNTTPLPANATIGEVARQLGIVGCIQSGVGDLSTNPVHMEGFGQSNAE